MSAIQWHAGEPRLCRELEQALSEHRAGGRVTVLLERPGRRRAARVELERGAVFVKQRVAPSSLEARVATALGLGSAAREWRALRRLHTRRVAVPEPLALGTRASGDALLVTRFAYGRTLEDALSCPRSERVRLLRAVGELVAQLHAAGFVHRDLHWGNVLVTPAGPLLLDLQAARPVPRGRWPRAGRLRDLGFLDYSVSARLSSADRLRLRAAALGFEPPFDAAEREILRAVGRASLRRAREHAASRTRRALRPGRAYERIDARGYRGLRVREVPHAEVVAALEASERPESRTLKHDHRARVTAVTTNRGSWVVKAYAGGGWLRRTADLWRGSPGRRAWLGGHGLRARGIGVAGPVAFVERRDAGGAWTSAVVFEDLQRLEPADRCPPDTASDAEVVHALQRLAIRLHRRGVIHGDLKASHVLLERRERGLEGRLIDLERVRFPRRLGDRPRIQALAELNASLPDRIPVALRRRAFQRYTAAVPFRGDADAALQRIVDISLAREHRWTGAGCRAARTGDGAGPESP